MKSNKDIKIIFAHELDIQEDPLPSIPSSPEVSIRGNAKNMIQRISEGSDDSESSCRLKVALTKSESFIFVSIVV